MAKKGSYFFELDDKQFGKTYAELVLMQRAIMSDARALAYWADGSGGGRFTPLAAAGAAAFVRAAIRGDHPELLTGEGYANSSAGSIRYQKWKEFIGGGNSPWTLTGATGESVIARKEMQGKKSMGVVTIDPNAETPQWSFSGKTTKWVKSKDVVKWLEFGTRNMPARPLIGKAIAKFISIQFPKMELEVQRALSAWGKFAIKNYKNPSMKQADLADFMSQASTGAGAEWVATRSTDRDFGEGSNEAVEILKTGGNIVSRGQSVADREMAKAEKQMIADMKAAGVDPAEIQRIVEGMRGV